MAESSAPRPTGERSTRLGFRVNANTKKLVMQAAALERRSMTFGN